MGFNLAASVGRAVLCAPLTRHLLDRAHSPRRASCVTPLPANRFERERETARHGASCALPLLERVRLQFFQRYEFERGSVRRFEIDRRRPMVVKCAFPTRDAYTPFIAGLEPGKTPLRVWRNEIVSIQDREIQKFLCDFDANRVLTDILRSRSTITVAIKSSHWVATTRFQFCS